MSPHRTYDCVQGCCVLAVCFIHEIIRGSLKKKSFFSFNYFYFSVCGRTFFLSSLLRVVYKYTNHTIIGIFLRIFPWLLLFFLHALFRLPEKNMNKNKSLFKTFSPRFGRWRLSRGARLFMLLLLTEPSSTMLFFCCWCCCCCCPPDVVSVSAVLALGGGCSSMC